MFSNCPQNSEPEIPPAVFDTLEAIRARAANLDDGIFSWGVALKEQSRNNDDNPLQYGRARQEFASALCAQGYAITCVWFPISHCLICVRVPCALEIFSAHSNAKVRGWDIYGRPDIQPAEDQPSHIVYREATLARALMCCDLNSGDGRNWRCGSTGRAYSEMSASHRSLAREICQLMASFDHADSLQSATWRIPSPSSPWRAPGYWSRAPFTSTWSTSR